VPEGTAPRFKFETNISGDRCGFFERGGRFHRLAHVLDKGIGIAARHRRYIDARASSVRVSDRWRIAASSSSRITADESGFRSLMR
jgi:hypothetical protein